MRRNLVTGHPIEPPWPQDTEFIMFGMGCFWGAERIFWQIDGVWTTFAAYAGGHQPDPTYVQVCTGLTGHAETVGVVYDPERVDVMQLLSEFWEQHDPTQGMRQGNDVGPQYRSIILTTNDAQMDAALRSRDHYQAALHDAGYAQITTEIRGLTTWYLAEDEHQQYLAKRPNGYCNHGFCQVAFPNPPAFDLRGPRPGAARQ